jgi:hypothetical protein
MEQAILYFRKRDVGFYYFKKGAVRGGEIALTQAENSVLGQ